MFFDAFKFFVHRSLLFRIRHFNLISSSEKSNRQSCRARCESLTPPTSFKLPSGITAQRVLQWVASMTLKIFLDDKSFHCLTRSIPPRSHSKLVLENDVHFLGSNAIVSCNETEAGNLLLYAEHYPGVVASIKNAFRSASLAVDQ
jgi:hypothetical protein